VLWVERLKAQLEPEGTDQSRQRLDSVIPRRKLTQILREVLHWVDFLAPLRDAAGDNIRIDDLDERLLAVIMAEGCNIGLANMAEATPGLTYIQLAHVAGRCLDDNALEKAIAKVITFYDQLPIARVWGDGTWSSADGKLVPTPVKALYARLHPKAPKGKRIVNYFTYVYDRLMPYWGKVIETTAHESIHEIDGLLHNEADLHPRKQASDNAGYADQVFGLASLLSIFYAPRIKDLADQRLFYFDKNDKKTFNHIGRLLVAKANTHLIKARWDNVIDLVMAVEQGFTPAARVLRKLQAAGEHHDLYRALQELGRIAKTIYLLSYLTSPELRREVERQLNKGENYHSLAEAAAWGNKGEVRLRDLQALLNRASCLRLVTSIIILFNAAYLQAAADKWRVAGVEIPEAHLAHIYPTSTSRINFLGDYSFRDEASLATQIHQLPIAEPAAEQLDLVLPE
jgi:TnpA family transposase